MDYQDALVAPFGSIRSEILYQIDPVHRIVVFDKSDSKFMHTFLKMPYYIKSYYTDSNNRVFPIYQSDKSELKNIGKDHNPFFDNTDARFFLVEASGIPIGRALAFRDRLYDSEKNPFKEKYYGKDIKTGWIGFFECVRSSEVANLLLKYCESYLKTNFNVDFIVANAEFNGNGRIGVLSKGFERVPFVLEGYNPRYYNDFFEEAGYKVRAFNSPDSLDLEGHLQNSEASRRNLNEFWDKWYSFIVSKNSNGLVETLEKYSKRFDSSQNDSQNNREKLLRRVNFDSIDSDVNKLIDFYNRVWSNGNHPHYRKMTLAEMETLKNDLLLTCSEDLTAVLERKTKEGESDLIGALIGIYDINETIKEIDEPFMRRVGELFYEDNTLKATELIKDYTTNSNLFFRDLLIIRRHMDKLRNNPLSESEEEKRRKILPIAIRFADYSSPILIYLHDILFGHSRQKILSYQKTNDVYKRARILIMGIDEEFRKRGYDVLLLAKLFSNASKRLPSIESVSGSLVADINLDMVGPLEKLGEKALEYNVYTKEF